MAQDERTTVYAIVIYPESTDIELMRQTLALLHVPAALSPLHDSDTYDDAELKMFEQRLKMSRDRIDPQEWKVYEGGGLLAGQLKKPHYHLVFDFGKQKKSYSQVLELVHVFSPTTRYVEPVRNKYGYVRYLAHLDEHDKAIYDPNEVEGFCGFDLSPLWAVSKEDKRTAVATLCDYASTYGIYNYCDLVDVVRELGVPALWDCVTEKSFFLSKYLEGLYGKATGAIKSDIDPAEVAALIQSGVRVNCSTGELSEVA